MLESLWNNLVPRRRSLCLQRGNYRDDWLKTITSVLATSLIKAKLMRWCCCSRSRPEGRNQRRRCKSNSASFIGLPLYFSQFEHKEKNSAIRLIWSHVVREVARAGKNAANWKNPCGEPFLFASSSSSSSFRLSNLGAALWRRHIWSSHYPYRPEIR